jgi:hypothetical protein
MLVRAACAALLMAFAATGFAAPPSKAQAPGPLTVVDATGKMVGRLGSGNNGNVAAVYLTVDNVNTSFLLGHVQQNGFDDWERVEPLAAGNRLFFATTDCSGTAYMTPGTMSRAIARQATPIKINGVNYLYVAQAVTPASVLILSMIENNTCTSAGGPSWQISIPLNAPVNLSTTFAEPYTVR